MTSVFVTGVYFGRWERGIAEPRTLKLECGWQPPGTPKLPDSTHNRRCRYDTSVECGACSMPRSSKLATDFARPTRSATAVSCSSGTSQRSA